MSKNIRIRKNFNEIKEKVEMKKRIISNKKKENLILTEMLSDKKEEISSLSEIVKVIDSSSYKKTFDIYEKKKRKLN